jgi:N-acetylglucosaminyldiphosphoundecaprenol N-acetyl-beta-D-mannosaminyltransferase
MVDPLPEVRLIFGVPFHDVTFEETVAWCVDRMKHRGPPACIATANVDFLLQARRDPELQRILFEADLVLADGMPIVWASRFVGPRLRERVTGSDLTPLLAEACAREGWRMFFLGGAPGVAERAAAELGRRYPGLPVAGCHSPPKADLLDMEHSAIRTRVVEARTDLLLVAFGAPKQEKFIRLNQPDWSIPVTIGVGGTLDFLAGVQTRAPAAFQAIGLEWLWRMGTDPRRLVRRYLANIGFLAAAWFRHIRIRLRPPGPAYGTGPATPWNTLADAMNRDEQVVPASLGNRSWLDSRELGAIAAAAARLRRRGGRLVLHGGTTRLHRLITSHGLDGVLDLIPDAEDAARRVADLARLRRDGEIHTEGNRLRIRLPADLHVASLPTVRNRTEAALTEEIRALDIDASPVDFLDSSGLGWLIALKHACDQHNRSFRIQGVQGRALRTVQLARVDGWLLG